MVWYTHSCYFNELKPAKVRCNSASFSFLNIGLFISHNKIAKWFWCQQDSNLDRRSRRYVSTVAPWPLPTVQKFFFIFSPFSVNAFSLLLLYSSIFYFHFEAFHSGKQRYASRSTDSAICEIYRFRRDLIWAMQAKSFAVARQVLKPLFLTAMLRGYGLFGKCVFKTWKLSSLEATAEAALKRTTIDATSIHFKLLFKTRMTTCGLELEKGRQWGLDKDRERPIGREAKKKVQRNRERM